MFEEIYFTNFVIPQLNISTNHWSSSSTDWNSNNSHSHSSTLYYLFILSISHYEFISITQWGIRSRGQIRQALGPIAFKIWQGPTKCSHQWPLKILVHFNTWCIEDTRKTKSGPEKKWRLSTFHYQGPKWPLKCLAYFDPW